MLQNGQRDRELEDSGHWEAFVAVCRDSPSGFDVDRGVADGRVGVGDGDAKCEKEGEHGW